MAAHFDGSILARILGTRTILSRVAGHAQELPSVIIQVSDTEVMLLQLSRNPNFRAVTSLPSPEASITPNGGSTSRTRLGSLNTSPKQVWVLHKIVLFNAPQ